MEDTVVRVVKRAERKGVAALYDQAGWLKPEYRKDLSFIDRVVADSFCFVGAFSGDRMVGMGRCVSDGISDAYIQDVAVLDEFRGMGLGRRIILKILEFLKSTPVDWIGLIAEPGTAEFYEKLGFKEMAGYVPMLWRGDERI